MFWLIYFLASFGSMLDPVVLGTLQEKKVKKSILCLLKATGCDIHLEAAEECFSWNTVLSTKKMKKILTKILNYLTLLRWLLSVTEGVELYRSYQHCNHDCHSFISPVSHSLHPSLCLYIPIFVIRMTNDKHLQKMLSLWHPLTIFFLSWWLISWKE